VYAIIKKSGKLGGVVWVLTDFTCKLDAVFIDTRDDGAFRFTLDVRERWRDAA
jgi:hypothetical protein